MLRAAVGAHIEHLFQSLYIFAAPVGPEYALLLPVGIVHKRLIGAALHLVKAHSGKGFPVKELVDIHLRPPGAQAIAPLGHDEVAAGRAGNIYVRPQPLEEFIGGLGYGRAQPVLAHESRGIYHQTASRLYDRLHALHIAYGGLELLLGYHAHFVQIAPYGQGAVKRPAEHKAHGLFRSADDVYKVQRRLMVGDDHKWALGIADLVP